jgi:hypothetical protein
MTALRNRFRDVFVVETGLKRMEATRLANRCVELIVECGIQPAAATAGSKPPGLPSPERSFDPYLFGAVAVLMREGRGRLCARLQEIRTIDDLRHLARAQNLSIPSGVSRIDEMRLALLESAERRVAHRRASAS